MTHRQLMAVAKGWWSYHLCLYFKKFAFGFLNLLNVTTVIQNNFPHAMNVTTPQKRWPHPHRPAKNPDPIQITFSARVLRGKSLSQKPPRKLFCILNLLYRCSVVTFPHKITYIFYYAP